MMLECYYQLLSSLCCTTSVPFFLRGDSGKGFQVSSKQLHGSLPGLDLRANQKREKQIKIALILVGIRLQMQCPGLQCPQLFDMEAWNPVL
uniref:Uncharacterized protein n=1 Tax=Rhizophora mucronata TaxID=61149 RepID=A0A2P2JDD2_RHIMU